MGCLRTSDSHKPSDSLQPKEDNAAGLLTRQLPLPHSNPVSNIIFVPFCLACVYHDTVKPD